MLVLRSVVVRTWLCTDIYPCLGCLNLFHFPRANVIDSAVYFIKNRDTLAMLCFPSKPGMFCMFSCGATELPIVSVKALEGL